MATKDDRMMGQETTVGAGLTALQADGMTPAFTQTTRPVQGTAALEHAHWCKPTAQHDEARTEIRIETFDMRNDAGTPFRTTRCLECGARFVTNQTTGAVVTEPGDNTLVPRSASQPS